MIPQSDLHYTIIRQIIDQGFAPSVAWLTQHFQTSESNTRASLRELQESHGVVLHPGNEEIWVIHPFSLAPTNFYVKSEKGEWWGTVVGALWVSLLY